MDDEDLTDIFSSFSTCTDKLESFIVCNTSNVKTLRLQTKRLYDETKHSYSFPDDQSLPELIVSDNFDDEQIWQQLELQNGQFLDSVAADIGDLASAGLVPSRRRKGKRSSPSEELDEEDDEDEEEDVDVEGESDTSAALSGDDEYYADFMKRAGAGSRQIAAGVTTDQHGLPVFGGDDECDDEDISDEDDRAMKQLLDRCEAEDGAGDDDEEDGSEMSVSEDDENIEAKDTDEEIEAYDLTHKKAGSSSTAADDTRNPTSDGKLAPAHPATKSIVKKSTRKRPNGKASCVDDRFFKMADMESFLRREDLAEERRRLGNDVADTAAGDDSDEDEDGDRDSDIDMFAEIPSSGDEEGQQNGKAGARDMNYAEFFDPPSCEDEDEDEDEDGEPSSKAKKKKSVCFNPCIEEKQISDTKQDLLAESSDNSDDDETVKSTFEKRQERMKKKITEMESASLNPKSWQMSGEVAAIRRPENSLMQEHLDFDHTSRPAPEITEDTTAKLEQLIIQRIKDQIFDDVERQVKPKEDAGEFKKTAVLNEEKSKLSLGEIYEAEYQKQLAKAKGEEKADVEDPQRAQIKNMMSSLFLKLDALSNFHYTPKQAPVEIKMVSNQPSLTVEDVAPVNMSSADRLAPEEILDKHRGDLKGDTERDSTDKKRDLRKKKKVQHEKRVHREQKDKDKLKQNNGKITSKSQALRNIETANSKEKVKVSTSTQETKSNLTSSKQFFSKLQDEIDTQIISKKAELNKKKANKAKISSTKLKL